MANQPLTYRDFNLEMTDWKDDGTFRVRVVGETPNGRTMRADQAETVVYRQEDFKRPLGKLSNRSATQDELMQLGAKLADLMLPGRVRTMFEDSLNMLEQKGEGLRLRLSIEPIRLSALPWEYTHVQRAPGEKVPNDFLAWQRHVSITRYENLGSALTRPTGKDKIRIVVALASPHEEPNNPSNFSPLDVKADETAITSAIGELKGKMPAVEAVVLKQATREALLNAISGTDIFHFAGHGVFDGAELAPDGTFRKKGQIVLETMDNKADPYPSDQLARILGDTGVRLVMLGACNSAARDEGGAWTGVAPALVREKIPAVVAMQYPVADTAASKFMTYAYARVLAGYTIDEAVFEGRLAIFSQAQDWAASRDWGAPVLYLRDDDGLLFPLPPLKPPVVSTAVNKRDLRNAIVNNFNLEELEELCANIEQDLADNGVSLQVNLDMVGGTSKAGKVLNLIEYLDHRGYLAHLVKAVRVTRPGII